jgi:hypothetical protein
MKRAGRSWLPPYVMPSELHEVAGLFRDLTEATLAVTAARKRGLETTDPANMDQDAAGFHLRVRTTGLADAVRQLLLAYGAYSATVVS